MTAIETRLDPNALRKQIEERAYSIWEAEGKVHGCDMDHWLKAESEISAALPAKAKSASPRPAAKSTVPSRKAQPLKK